MIDEIRMIKCPYCEETFDLSEDNWIGTETNPIGVCPNCHEIVFVDNILVSQQDDIDINSVNPTKEAKEAFKDCDNFGERMEMGVELIGEALKDK